MNVVIIEDEAPAYRRLEKILLEIDPKIRILEVLDSVESATAWFNSNPTPDLALMDIHISDGLSFQIFEETDVACPVIFATAFDEYLMRAFKVNSVDYLLKPIKKEELEAALEKYERVHNNGNSNEVDLPDILKKISLTENSYKGRFLVKIGERMISIKTEDIVCFQSKNGIVYIVTEGGKKYISDYTLDDLQGQLDPKSFFRANRQFIVQAEYVDTVHRYFKGKLLLEMQDLKDEEIIISTEKASSFKDWLNQ